MSLIIYCICLIIFLVSFFKIGSMDLWFGVTSVVTVFLFIKLIQLKSSILSTSLQSIVYLVLFISNYHLWFLKNLLSKRNYMLKPRIIHFKEKKYSPKEQKWIHIICQLVPGISSVRKSKTELILYHFSLPKEKDVHNFLNRLKVIIRGNRS